MAKPTVLDTAREMVTDAVCRVLDFINEPDGSKIDLVALLPRLSVVQALLVAITWESKMEITRSAYAITWTNSDFPSLELSVWWPKTMVKALFVADEADGRLRPVRFPHSSPSMGIKWRGVKNASPRSREARIRELTFDSVFPIVYPEEHKGEPYDRPPSILARDVLLSAMMQRWLSLFAAMLSGKTAAQREAKAQAEARYAQANNDSRLLCRLLLELNVDFKRLYRVSALLAEAGGLLKQDRTVDASLYPRLCTIQDHIHDDLEQLAANASEAELPCNPFVPRPGVHFRVGMNRDGYLIGTETYRPATVVSDTGVIMNKFEPSWVRTEDLEVK